MTLPSADVARVLAAELASLLDGSARDIQEFGARVAANLTTAAATGDPLLVDEVRGQVRALAELQRLRAGASGWRAVEAVVGVAGRLLLIAGGIVRPGGAA